LSVRTNSRHGELDARAVDGESPQGRSVEAHALGAADAVLDSGVGAVVGREVGELSGFGVGGEDLEVPGR
jgi:hypothetical protein